MATRLLQGYHRLVEKRPFFTHCVTCGRLIIIIIWLNLIFYTILYRSVNGSWRCDRSKVYWKTDQTKHWTNSSIHNIWWSLCGMNKQANKQRKFITFQFYLPLSFFLLLYIFILQYSHFSIGSCNISLVQISGSSIWCEKSVAQTVAKIGHRSNTVCAHTKSDRARCVGRDQPKIMAWY